jgi:hypothetical protein
LSENETLLSKPLVGMRLKKDPALFTVRDRNCSI